MVSSHAKWCPFTGTEKSNGHKRVRVLTCVSSVAIFILLNYIKWVSSERFLSENLSSCSALYQVTQLMHILKCFSDTQKGQRNFKRETEYSLDFPNEFICRFQWLKQRLSSASRFVRFKHAPRQAYLPKNSNEINVIKQKIIATFRVQFFHSKVFCIACEQFSNVHITQKIHME